jgi:diguanylate cyclase (GGDEF)-like protein/PAS domain S-box-containing protein
MENPPDTTELKRAFEALTESERRVRLALTGSCLALFEWDIESGSVYLSDEWANIVGGPPGPTFTTFEELEQLVPPEDAAGLRNPIVDALKGTAPFYRTEHRVRTRSGELRWIQSNGQVVERDQCGRALKLVGTNADITARKQIEQKLEQEHQLLNAVLENIEAGIAACDNQGVLTLFNRATREFHGLPQEPLPPEAWTEHYDFYQPDGKTPMTTQFIPLFRALQGEHVHNAEMMIVPKHGGRARILLASGQALYASDGTKLGAVVAMHDITERKQMEQRLEFLAQHDALTVLPNRNQFQERIELAMARCRRSQSLMALLFLDIDNFKTINDTLGHAAGDKLLQCFADRLLQCVRTTDTVSRLAGDEFTIIVEDLHDEDAASVIAQKILTVMESDVMLEGRRVQVSTSVGIAYYKGDLVASVETLMQQADAALYRAKQGGRKAFCVADEKLPLKKRAATAESTE